jgi:hypothetical protein
MGQPTTAAYCCTVTTNPTHLIASLCFRQSYLRPARLLVLHSRGCCIPACCWGLGVLCSEAAHCCCTRRDLQVQPDISRCQRHAAFWYNKATQVSTFRTGLQSKLGLPPSTVSNKNSDSRSHLERHGGPAADHCRGSSPDCRQHTVHRNRCRPRVDDADAACHNTLEAGFVPCLGCSQGPGSLLHRCVQHTCSTATNPVQAATQPRELLHADTYAGC